MSANVSVVIPSRNRGQSIIRTLQSLIATDPLPFEVILVDQSDEQGQASVLQSFKKAAQEANWACSVEIEGQPPAVPGRLRLIQSSLRGAARARNSGTQAARSEIVLFTDDDTLVEPNWIGELSQAFEQSAIWGVYGRILPFEETVPDDGTSVRRTNTVPHVFTEVTLPWYLGSGANMAFRRSFLLDRAHGMDEILSIGAKFRAFEDIDIGYRALVFGGQVAYVPMAVVYHNSPKTFTQQLKTEAGYGLSVGAAFVKYWRCGDRRAGPMLLQWVWQMGVRRGGAGLLKWRSWKVVRLALLQFWWPLVGVSRAWRQPIDHYYWLFRF